MRPALALLALLWAGLAWADGPTDPAMPIVPRPPEAPPARTISILTGSVSYYSVTAEHGRVTLRLLMRVPREGYEQLPAFRGCAVGCRLRVYIVQERP